MLTLWDEYPLHQLPEPVVVLNSADPAQYERYWFNGIDADSETYFGIGFGIYPVIGLVDAAFSVVRGQQQEALFACAPMTWDRATTAGPLSLEIVEPMRKIRFRVANAQGISADLLFEATTPANKEPRSRRMDGANVIADITRLTQFGRWTGTFEIDGKRTDLGSGWPAVRDRSWGRRAIATAAQAQLGAKPRSAWFCWAVMHLDDGSCLHGVLNDDSDGRAIAKAGALLPGLQDGAPVVGPGIEIPHYADIQIDVEHVPGTRRPKRASIALSDPLLPPLTVEVTPSTAFQMKGIGYFHPLRGHGAPCLNEPVRRESWNTSELDPNLTENRHTQQIARVVLSDGRTGVGAFEHLSFGAHRTTGHT